MTDTASSSQVSSQISNNSVQSGSSGQDFGQGNQTLSSTNIATPSSDQVTTPDTSTPINTRVEASDLGVGQASISIDQLAPAGYVPSELERKRAVMMYFLIGVVVSLQSGSNITEYERFHLQQSLGRWAIFSMAVFVIIIYVAIFFFVRRGMMTLPALILLVYIGLRSYFVYQAWKGKDVSSPQGKIVLPIFSDLGGRLLGVFEISRVR